jgi:tetratricopeptide (TPR) repeat protein
VAKIYLINSTDDFETALREYEKHLFTCVQWERFGDKKFFKGDEFLVYQNNRPEDTLTFIRLIDLLKKHPWSTIPTLIMTPKLSEPCQLLIDDIELMWSTPLPFDAGDFYEKINNIAIHSSAYKESYEFVTQVVSLISSNQLEKALALAASAKQKFLSDFQASLTLGRICLSLGRLSDAERHIKAALGVKPNSFEAKKLLAIHHIKSGQWSDVEKLVEETSKVTEYHLTNMIHWGNVYVNEGQAERGSAVFKKVLDIRPDSVEARHGALAADLIAGKVDAAKIFQDDPPHLVEIAQMCNLRAISLCAHGQFKQAEQLYHNALYFFPNKEEHYKLWMNLGLCMKKSHNNLGALHYLKKCQETAPPSYQRVAEQISAVEAKLHEGAEGKRMNIKKPDTIANDADHLA